MTEYHRIPHNPDETLPGRCYAAGRHIDLENLTEDDLSSQLESRKETRTNAKLSKDRKLLSAALWVAFLSQGLLFFQLYEDRDIPSRLRVLQEAIDCRAELNTLYRTYFDGSRNRI